MMYAHAPRELRVSVLKTFLVPIIALAFLTLFIPYIIKNHTIYTTQYIYAAMILPPVLISVVMYVAKKITINFDHSQLLDYFMTGLILCISAPVLVMLGLIALLVIWVFPKTAYVVIWLVGTITIFMLCVRIKYNKSLPKSNDPLIVVPNHSSFLDYFLSALIMGYRRPWTVVYGTNLHKYPILRYFLKKYGVGVDRENHTSRISANAKITESLKQGRSILIFPEGTRLRFHQADEILLQFRDGAFRASVETGYSIVPVILKLPLLYSRPERPLPLSPRKITITFCDPISPKGYTVKELKEHVHDTMKTLLV